MQKTENWEMTLNNEDLRSHRYFPRSRDDVPADKARSGEALMVA